MIGDGRGACLLIPFSRIFIPLAVLVYLALVACNDSLNTTRTPQANQVHQTNAVKASPSPDESTSTFSPISDFPLELGTTWLYSSTHYDSISPSERITATYLITETIVETQQLGEFYAAKLIQNSSIVTSSIDISDARFDNFLLEKNWAPSYWYVISETSIYLQHELAIEEINSAGPRYKFPLSDDSSWNPIPELPNIYTLAISIGNFAIPAGSFEHCFQVVTVFLSGPRFEWLCNGVGIVREKHDHRGTPFGYEKVLIGFWEGEE